MNAPHAIPTIVETEIERPLGPTEEAHHYCDYLAPPNFTVRLELRGPVTEAAITHALCRVQRRHPRLRVYVEAERGRRPWFRSGVGEIPLRVVDGPRELAIRVGEEEASTAMLGRVPLARAAWIRHGKAHGTVLLTFDHAASDGRSAFFVARDFLVALGARLEGRADALSPLPTTESLEDALARELGSREIWRRRLASVRRIAAQQESLGAPDVLDADLVVPAPAYRVLQRPMELGPELSAAVAKRARAEHTTVHGALLAALGTTWCEERGGGSRTLVYSSAVSLRERMAYAWGESSSLCFAGAGSNHRTTADGDFWQLARDTRAGLEGALDAGMHTGLVPALFGTHAFVGRILGPRHVGMLAKLIHKTSPQAVGVSNVGRYELGPDFGPVRLERLGFASTASLYSTLFTIAVSCNGLLTWNFSCNEPSMSKEQLDRLAEGAVKRLERAVAR